MRLSFFSGTDRIEICERGDSASGLSTWPVGSERDEVVSARVILHDPWQVECFVRRYLRGAAEVHRLRRLLASQLPLTDRLSDEEVLRQIARSLQSGNLCAYLDKPPTPPATRLPMSGAAVALVQKAPSSAPPSAVPRRGVEVVAPPASEEPVDAAQDVEAAMLVEAAKHGTPFCEECERAERRAAG